jgi:hypothetical protein
MSLSKGVIYYTDNRLDDLPIGKRVREELLKANLPIVSCSLKPLDFGKNIWLDRERGYATMFYQIFTCIAESNVDIVYFCEHDVLYPVEHFEYTPPRPDMFYYDLNWWKVGNRPMAVHWDAAQVSGLACHRQLALDYYAERVKTFDPDNFDRKFEPAIDGILYDTWWADKPHIDVRGNWNLTYNKWKLDHFRKKETAVNFQEKPVNEIEGWDLTDIL